LQIWGATHVFNYKSTVVNGFENQPGRQNQDLRKKSTYLAAQVAAVSEDAAWADLLEKQEV